MKLIRRALKYIDDITLGEPSTIVVFILSIMSIIGIIIDASNDDHK